MEETRSPSAAAVVLVVILLLLLLVLLLLLLHPLLSLKLDHNVVAGRPQILMIPCVI